MNEINEDPEFNWWVKDTLRIWYLIISTMERRSVYEDATGQGGANNKYWCNTHKAFIEVLETVEDDL